MPDWLPPLLPLSASGGDWTRYLETLYAHFCRDFVDDKPSFQGIKLAFQLLLPVQQGAQLVAHFSSR